MTHPGVLLKREKLFAGKEMGQNFLSDPGTALMIVQRTGIAEDTKVLEIGPGLGALTRHICRVSKNVTVVEKDRRIIPLLQEELAEEGMNAVQILNQDILKTDFAEIAQGEQMVVISNLPYNISSQILFRIIKNRSLISSAYLMFQKELAQRIMSPPGSKSYSRLSAVVQYAADIRHVADIKPAAFFPRPDVDSTVLAFDLFQKRDLDEKTEDLLFDVIKAAFSKRRKTLKNSMSGGEMGMKKPFVGQALEMAGIQPERRAETLSVDEFKAITLSVQKLMEDHT
ncbi:MAG: 16S rRNA (adenine(1518)-N(6)/adenine(1519)-N(6))-dimethyltransferase RsmA [Desulfobacterales bacterium]|nr:16S rRNA (adenine(1518)-N(6)/adenine(1519)-N(6))-dimethyltransferase RsmA [Desulfobacterales bacterium]